MMREAVSLMGGYGITEDCPGFLGHKWMDAQLEATYEGPEAVQRRQLSVTMADELFLAQFREWMREMREHCQRPARNRRLRAGHRHADVAVDAPAPANAADADGEKLYQSSRQGVTFPLADALCWLLASRAQILDLMELEKKGPENPTLAEGLPDWSLSSPTSATYRRRAPPAKWGASAPSWCSATTAIRRGIPKAAPPVTRRTTWRPGRADSGNRGRGPRK